MDNHPDRDSLAVKNSVADHAAFGIACYRIREPAADADVDGTDAVAAVAAAAAAAR